MSTPPSRDRRVAPRPPRWLLAVKLVIAGCLIAWVLRKAPLGDVLAAIAHADGRLVGLALLLNGVTVMCSATRWRLLLRSQGVRAPYSYLVKSFLVGIFFNNLLPSTMGGDAVRAYDSWRAGLSKSESLAVIVVDRLLGLAALVAIAVVAVPLASRWGSSLAGIELWLGGAAAFFAGFTWLLLTPSARLRAWSSRLPLPALLQRLVRKILGALQGYDRAHRTLLAGFGISLLLQTLMIVHYWVIARALGVAVPLAAFFLIIPISLIIMLVPVSINAIGVRENVFAFFFAAYGVGTVHAVAFAWVAWGLVLIEAVIGAMIYGLRTERMARGSAFAAPEEPAPAPSPLPADTVV